MAFDEKSPDDAALETFLKTDPEFFSYNSDAQHGAIQGWQAALKYERALSTVRRVVSIENVVAALTRFRTEMAVAGIMVSGFEVATETERQMLDEIGAPHVVARIEGGSGAEIVGMGILVKQGGS